MAGSSTSARFGMLLQAEVAAGSQTRFERRYRAATGRTVSPGNPKHYQDQPNKWGAELRLYFNSPVTAASFRAAGVHVEQGRRGYLAGTYRYRVNNNAVWWNLVEDEGLRLGTN